MRRRCPRRRFTGVWLWKLFRSKFRLKLSRRRAVARRVVFGTNSVGNSLLKLYRPFEACGDDVLVETFVHRETFDRRHRGRRLGKSYSSSSSSSRSSSVLPSGLYSNVGIVAFGTCPCQMSPWKRALKFLLEDRRVFFFYYYFFF